MQQHLVWWLHAACLRCSKRMYLDGVCMFKTKGKRTRIEREIVHIRRKAKALGLYATMPWFVSLSICRDLYSQKFNIMSLCATSFTNRLLTNWIRHKQMHSRNVIHHYTSLREFFFAVMRACSLFCPTFQIGTKNKEDLNSGRCAGNRENQKRRWKIEEFQQAHMLFKHGIRRRHSRREALRAFTVFSIFLRKRPGHTFSTFMSEKAKLVYDSLSDLSDRAISSKQVVHFFRGDFEGEVPAPRRTRKTSNTKRRYGAGCIPDEQDSVDFGWKACLRTSQSSSLC